MDNNSEYKILLRYIFSAIGLRLFSFFLIIVFWFLVSWLSRGEFPAPYNAIEELLDFVKPQLSTSFSDEPSLWTHIFSSGLRAYGSLLLSLLIFVPIGIFLGTNNLTYKLAIGSVEFARSIPAFLFILVLMSVRMSGETIRIFCIIFATGTLLTDYTVTAIRNVPSERTEILRLMGANYWTVFWQAIWIPLLLKAVMPALRICVGIALIVTLVVEYLIPPETGIGVIVVSKMGNVSIAGSLAIIIIAGLLGWIGNLIVAIVSDILWWFYEGRPFVKSRV